MSDYRVKEDWNQSLVSLTVLNPQPKSTGLLYAQREFAFGGNVWDQAPHIQLIWDHLESPDEVMDIYTLFGLNDSKQSFVTVYMPNELYVYTRYNGKAIRPQASWSNYFPRNVTIIVRDLEIVA